MVPRDYKGPFDDSWVELGMTVAAPNPKWKLSNFGRRHFAGEGSVFAKLREREGPFITKLPS